MLDLFTEDAEFESVSNTNDIIKTNDRKQLRELALSSAKYFEQRTQAPSSWVIEANRRQLKLISGVNWQRIYKMARKKATR